MWQSTDQVPWSIPQLSLSIPTQTGSTTRATSWASSGEPGARVLDVEQLLREAEEVVDGPWLRHAR